MSSMYFLCDLKIKKKFISLFLFLLTCLFFSYFFKNSLIKKYTLGDFARCPRWRIFDWGPPKIGHMGFLYLAINDR